MTNSDRISIYCALGKWKVLRAKARRASGVFAKKHEAVKFAIHLLRNCGGRIHFHDRAGQVVSVKTLP